MTFGLGEIKLWIQTSFRAAEDVDLDKRVQILDKAVCCSYRTNTLGKGMNSTILPPDMNK